jgi:glutaredoxin
MKKIGSDYNYLPKIFADNVFIGGYDDLKKLI